MDDARILGAALLNLDGVTARLQGAGGSSGIQPVPAAGGGSGAAPGGAAAEGAQADFVILWPALGCPELVDPDDPVLELMFVATDTASSVNDAYVLRMADRIQVLTWASAMRPYREDGCAWDPAQMTKTPLRTLIQSGPGTIEFRDGPKDLETYRGEVKDRPRRLGTLLQTTADVVPRAYLAKGFRTIAAVRLKLQRNAESGGVRLQPGSMFTLYFEPETSVLRSILEDPAIMSKPFADIPTMRDGGSESLGGSQLLYKWRHDAQVDRQPRYGDRDREHVVRLHHPFSVMPARDYLNVGHLTDPHISTLWDYFDRQLFDQYDTDVDRVVGTAGRVRNVDAPMIPERYNNPNVNVRNLSYLLKSGARNGRGENAAAAVDVIVQTGDLIDFNRGFNCNPDHRPDLDYVFNVNWLRYYELLLLDYNCPTFTVLGNHERRLNPYPPRIRAEAEHLWLLLFLLVALGAVGAGFGTVHGAFEEVGGDHEEALRKFAQFWLGPLITFSLIFLFALALGSAGLNADTAWDALTAPNSLSMLIGIGGLLMGGVLVFLCWILTEEETIDMKGWGLGALWGLLFGGSIGFAGVVIALIYMYQQHDYMTHITNLRSDDLAVVLNHKNVAYLNAFDKDGLLYMDEGAVSWYALVINPFLDYAFEYRNMSFALLDWSGSEVLSGDPPPADDVLTDRQWKVLEEWSDWAIHRRGEIAVNKQAVAIVGLHSPVLCPMLDADLRLLHNESTEADASNLRRGILTCRRSALIKRLYDMSSGTLSDGRPIEVLSLTGHTHDYDVFVMESEDRVRWRQSVDYRGQMSVLDGKALHITTTCAGPPSDGAVPSAAVGTLDPEENINRSERETAIEKIGRRVVRPSGCRVIRFDAETGRLFELEEISAITAKWGTSGE